MPTLLRHSPPDTNFLPLRTLPIPPPPPPFAGRPSFSYLFRCVSQEGDEEALVIKYDCKLVHRLENEFSPYTRCDAQDVMLKLAGFVVDPRFQGSSLFLKLYGDALGPVADMVKAAYNYIIKAADIKPRKVSAIYGGVVPRLAWQSLTKGLGLINLILL